MKPTTKIRNVGRPPDAIHVFAVLLRTGAISFANII